MTEQPAATMGTHRVWRPTLFCGIIVVGALLRLIALGKVPGGLNSDEASSGVEALSILRTGMDLWGNHFPVWFPAWGSGMNALYTYIAVPVVWAFGLDSVTLRAVGAVLGVLTLPVAYYATRLYFGRPAALIVMGLLAVLPWHVMSSRWALDSNLAPLFFTLGLYTIGKALESGGRWPLLAWAPWAISIYAYPVMLYPIIPSSLAVVIFFRSPILAAAGIWAAGIALALLIDLPFILFLLKNYALHIEHLPGESALPFSVPALAATRLSQIHQPLTVTIFNNLTFLVGGYRDEAVWHQSRYFLPLTGAAPYLTAAGAVALAWRCVKARQPRVILANVILIVAAAIVVPIVAIPLQVTRLNWFYIPSLMLAAQFLTGLPGEYRRQLLVASGIYLMLFLAPFYAYYATSYNQEATALDRNLGNGFRLGLEGTLRGEAALARPDEPIFIDAGQPQPYLYPLFYGLASVEDFQATRQMQTIDGVYVVSRFGRFYFEKDALPAGQSYVFASRADDMPCANPEALKTGPLWATGRCPAG
jgi:4-amino-4-deoxy-L-arabinose transferase-like glycosyltransferase